MFKKQEQDPSLPRNFYPVSSHPVREYCYMRHDRKETVKRVYEHRPPQGQPAAADIVRKYTQTRSVATYCKDIDFNLINRNFDHEANNNSDYDEYEDDYEGNTDNRQRFEPAVEIFAEYVLASERTVIYTKITPMKAVTFELVDAEGYTMKKTTHFENSDESKYAHRQIIEVDYLQESN